MLRTYKNETDIIQSFIDINGRPVSAGLGETIIYEVSKEGSSPSGFTGDSYQYPRLDPATFSLETITHPHTAIHQGDAFNVHIVEADFDKISEIGLLFKTPDTKKWCHVIPLVGCGAASVFDVLEAPTLDTGNYPTSFLIPENRNRNSDKISTVLSIQATPVANKVSLKGKADTTPITDDGLVLHTEIIGVGKRGEGIGNRDTDEYVLKQNTIYYFRLKGTPFGADDTVATLELTWYEIIDKEEL